MVLVLGVSSSCVWFLFPLEVVVLPAGCFLLVFVQQVLGNLVVSGSVTWFPNWVMTESVVVDLVPPFLLLLIEFMLDDRGVVRVVLICFRQGE